MKDNYSREIRDLPSLPSPPTYIVAAQPKSTFINTDEFVLPAQSNSVSVEDLDPNQKIKDDMVGVKTVPIGTSY
jgi:hypothetical protein